MAFGYGMCWPDPNPRHHACLSYQKAGPHLLEELSNVSTGGRFPMLLFGLAIFGLAIPFFVNGTAAGVGRPNDVEASTCTVLQSYAQV